MRMQRRVIDCLKNIDCSHLIGKFNIGFIAIAIIFFVFSRSIFRLLHETAMGLGSVWAPPFHFFSAQCRAIEQYPLVYFLGCILYYAASVKFFKSGTNTIINTALLFYFAALLLYLGLPFFYWKDVP